MTAMTDGLIDCVAIEGIEGVFFQHCAVIWTSGESSVTTWCGCNHVEWMDYLDCPVAGNWCLVRAS